jgi:hypothetical protein
VSGNESYGGRQHRFVAYLARPEAQPLPMPDDAKATTWREPGGGRLHWFRAGSLCVEMDGYWKAVRLTGLLGREYRGFHTTTHTVYIGHYRSPPKASAGTWASCAAVMTEHAPVVRRPSWYDVRPAKASAGMSPQQPSLRPEMAYWLMAFSWGGNRGPGLGLKKC